MGFRPADDSDLGGSEPKRRSSSPKSGMHQASFDDDDYAVKRKAQNKKRKKKKKKKNSVLTYVWTFAKVFGVTVGVFVLGFGILVFCSIMGWLGNIDEIPLEALLAQEPSKIYYIDSKGEEAYLTTLYNGRKQQWVDIEKIPKDMQYAFVAIEDERYYKHSGVDLIGTTKATAGWVWDKVTGSHEGRGGSTITQQLVKNVTGNWENTPTRKVKEMSQAVNLEKRFTKDEILELYMNIINLSNGCYGVQAASNEIFGKDVSELNLAECACIAGITQNPTAYDPFLNPKDNKKKQELVLEKMLELEFISKAEYDKAMNYELAFNTAKGDSAATGVNEYYVEYLTKSIVSDLVKEGYTESIANTMVYMGGLKIVTTVSPNIQKAIDEVYTNPANCANIFGYAEGDSVNPESAIVVLAPDGSIKGMYGCLGKKTANLILDRTTVPRQPGSSIKPISVYSTAIEEGLINASTLYSDSPKSFGNWTPKNVYSGGGGDITVQLALQKSSNIVASRVLDDLGVEKAYKHLEDDLNITSLDSTNDKNLPALALGGLTNGISPMEMAAAYTPFVNEGIYTKPYIYTKVYQGDTLILSNTPETKQAISKTTAYIMTQLLRRVVTSGTGTSAQLSSGVFTAGKTGTTDDNKDKWFVGFTPNYVCAVWYGYDNRKPITAHTTACQIAFKTVMDKAHLNTSVKSISAPSGIVQLSVCSDTGYLASGGCPAISLPYTNDNKPTRYCTSHSAPQPSESEETDNESGEKIHDIDAPEIEPEESGAAE